MRELRNAGQRLLRRPEVLQEVQALSDPHKFEPREMLNGRETKMCKHCGEFENHPNHR